MARDIKNVARQYLTGYKRATKILITSACQNEYLSVTPCVRGSPMIPA